MATADRIKVLVADDEESVRDVLSALLGSEPDLDVVGMATDAESAIEMAATQMPDVALVDVQMPGGGGPRAAREIIRRSPPTRVIAFSAHEDMDTVLRMLRAGAFSYVSKSDSTDEILWAIYRSVQDPTDGLAQPASPVAAVAELVERRRPASLRPERHRNRVKQVIRDNDFKMVYQPIVALEEREMVGAEALARFTPLPRRSPEAWLAEADTAGLLVDLEVALATAALEQLDRLPPLAYLAINASPRTAASDALRKVFLSVDTNRIVLEMTEHAPIDDYDGLADALKDLREAGLRLAIDDAGAGFASLRHIVRLDPDLIKLDVSLTDGIDRDPVRQALAVALVSFAEQIGAAVVAEGVETEGELDALRGAGVPFAQGFHLGMPGPVPEDGFMVKFGPATSR